VHFQYGFVDNWLKEMHCQRLRRLDRFFVGSQGTCAGSAQKMMNRTSAMVKQTRG